MRKYKHNSSFLDLSDDNIMTIESIEHLTNWTFLYVQNNKIKKITQSSYNFIKNNKIKVIWVKIDNLIKV